MNFDYTAHGGQGHDDGGGFGQKDLDEMKRLNYSPEQIKILANLAPSQGVKVYKPVQWYAENVAKPPWQYGAHGDASFGMKDINAAQKIPGVNYNKIKGYADWATEKGIGVHQGAKDWLTNNDPAVLGANKTPVSSPTYDFNAVGGPGIGVKDIDKMQSEGYSPAQIRIAANTASTKGVEIHSGASDWVKENTEKPPWQYGAHGCTDFGMQDVEAAEATPGVSYQTIKDYAEYATEKGIGVAPKAKDWIANNDPISLGADKSPGDDWTTFDFNAVGDKEMGIKDIDKMQSEGYSPEQIRIFSNTAEKRGVKVHSGASDWVKENTEKLPWQYAKHGSEIFGIADVKAASKMPGVNYQTIKGYADFATEKGIGVGQSAKEWLATNNQASMDAVSDIGYDPELGYEKYDSPGDNPYISNFTSPQFGYMNDPSTSTVDESSTYRDSNEQGLIDRQNSVENAGSLLNDYIFRIKESRKPPKTKVGIIGRESDDESNELYGRNLKENPYDKYDSSRYY